MKIEVPAGHQLGMGVPKGGSSCAKCKYVSADHERCSMTLWVDAPKAKGGGGGSSKLPKPADEFCCDMFEAAKKTALKVTAKEVLRNG